MTSKKAKIFLGAFGAGLRPWPSATISYHLCNFWHPVASLPRALRGRETRETSYLLASGCRSLVTISLMSISAAISDAA